MWRRKVAGFGSMQHSFWKKLVTTGTQIVLPDVCAGCGVAGAWICDDCYLDALPINLRTCCQQCGSPASDGPVSCPRCQGWPPVDFLVRSAFEFSGPVRQSILRMKYRGEYARSVWHGGHLGDLLTQTGWDVDIILPVPLHRSRVRSRGYNQSEKLARDVGKRLGLRVADSLSRQRNTLSQTTLSRDQRAANVAGAFTCLPEVAGLSVLLIDDVMTTGSTLLECAFACDLAGASEFRALTVATDV
jgi:competence protein ComFC